MKNVIIWILYFIPALLVELLCYLLNPIVALFVTHEMRTDRVKRSPWDGGTFTLRREYLIKPLRWFQSHDNACDEWWYGAFNTDSHFKYLREATQEQYDSSWWLRYLCRVMWLYRNNAYGFLFNLFSRPLETNGMNYEHGMEDNGEFWYFLQVFPSSWKLEMQVPVVFTNRYLSINIGWKSHRSAPKPQLLYANRIIGFRQYE